MSPRIVHPRDAQQLVILGIPHNIFIRGADTDGAIVFLETHIPAGMALPPHMHTREDELFYVTSGEIEFMLDGRTFTAVTGTTVLGPRNVPHSYASAGGRAASMTVTIRPSGIEDMFLELSRLPPGPPDLARVVEICGRFGVQLL